MTLPDPQQASDITRRTSLVRLLVAAVVLAAAGLLAPASAYASGGQDNSAVAVNTKDGSSVFKFAFSVARVMGDSVTNTNAAIAYASCIDCQTTAIAIQVVIVQGDPATFTPTNTAIAVNELCDLCDTLASAYQFVVQTSGPVHFTPEGHKQLEEIRRQVNALRRTSLTAAEIQARLDELTGRLRQILSTELVAAGPPDRAASPPSADPSGSPADPTTSTAPASTSTTARAASSGSSTSTTSMATTSTTVPPSTSEPTQPTTTSSTSGPTTTTEPSTTSTSTTGAAP